MGEPGQDPRQCEVRLGLHSETGVAWYAHTHTHTQHTYTAHIHSTHTHTHIHIHIHMHMHIHMHIHSTHTQHTYTAHTQHTHSTHTHAHNGYKTECRRSHKHCDGHQTPLHKAKASRDALTHLRGGQEGKSLGRELLDQWKQQLQHGDGDRHVPPHVSWSQPPARARTAGLFHSLPSRVDSAPTTRKQVHTPPMWYPQGSQECGAVHTATKP
jgi:hypothetical protein